MQLAQESRRWSFEVVPSQELAALDEALAKAGAMQPQAAPTNTRGGRPLRVPLQPVQLPAVTAPLPLFLFQVTRDFGIHCRGVVELSDLASRVIAPPQRWSLAALVAHVFKRQVPKPPGVRLGKWDARVLSREQESYAALDAWASLRLHTQLRALPLLPPPEPPPELQVEQLQGCAASTAVTSAVAAPAALSHAKQGVLEMHLAGLTVPQIAAARGIKPVTVENYLAEALVAGHGYFWHLLGVPDAALALNDAAVASEPSDAPAQAAAGAATDADAALRGRMKELKARLPEWISFSFIRLALAHRDREATSENHGQ